MKPIKWKITNGGPIKFCTKKLLCNSHSWQVIIVQRSVKFYRSQLLIRKCITKNLCNASWTLVIWSQALSSSYDMTWSLFPARQSAELVRHPVLCCFTLSLITFYYITKARNTNWWGLKTFVAENVLKWLSFPVKKTLASGKFFFSTNRFKSN